MTNNPHDWKNNIPYPYKGNTLNDPQYIKDKDQLFSKHGNGWWWCQGFNQQGRSRSTKESHQEKKRGIRGRFTQK